MTGAYAAAVKASIYTQPGAIMPFLDPLMRVLARHFPDAGLKTVSFPAKSGRNMFSRKLLKFRPLSMAFLERLLGMHLTPAAWKPVPFFSSWQDDTDQFCLGISEIQ